MTRRHASLDIPYFIYNSDSIDVEEISDTEKKTSPLVTICIEFLRESSFIRCAIITKYQMEQYEMHVLMNPKDQVRFLAIATLFA